MKERFPNTFQMHFSNEGLMQYRYRHNQSCHPCNFQNRPSKPQERNMTVGGFYCDTGQKRVLHVWFCFRDQKRVTASYEEREQREESQTSCTIVSWIRSCWRKRGREWGHERTRLICGWISGHSLHAQRNHFTSKNSKESLPQDTGVDVGSDQ